MKRMDKNEFLMKATFLVAQRSTCCNIQVGAVIAIDGHIISTGYNGGAPGRKHCCDYFKDKIALHNFGSSPENIKLFQREHHIWSLKNEIHAEINAIIFAAKKGVKIENADIYITHQPCIVCSKFIVQAGIKRVFYRIDYKRDTDIEVLNNNNIEVIKL